MQRIKMVWLPLQNFPIAALCGCQIALLMQRHPLIELGLQCRSRIPCLRLGIAGFGHATSYLFPIASCGGSFLLCLFQPRRLIAAPKAQS
jgi:hypothetical protein